MSFTEEVGMLLSVRETSRASLDELGDELLRNPTVVFPRLLEPNERKASQLETSKPKERPRKRRERKRKRKRTHHRTRLIPPSMRRLPMTVNQHVVDLLLHRHRSLIMGHHKLSLVLQDRKHLLCPEPELSGRGRGVPGILEDEKNIVVHLLSDESLLSLSFGEVVEVVVDDGLEDFLGWEVLGVKRVGSELGGGGRREVGGGGEAF